MPRLVLASASPRRREILRNAGIDFEVRAAPVDERLLPGEQPVDYVLRLAKAKAAAVPVGCDEVVLGADTVVVVDGEILEKPVDAADARRMLGLISGRTHIVLTGICLRSQQREISEVSETAVRFAPLTARAIDEYVGSGEPMDKAGAYAIQGRASKWVDRIEGCYFNVVGLPVSLVWKQLQTIAPPAE